jgi:hypothetical protein
MPATTTGEPMKPLRVPAAGQYGDLVTADEDRPGPELAGAGPDRIVVAAVTPVLAMVIWGLRLAPGPGGAPDLVAGV